MSCRKVTGIRRSLLRLARLLGLWFLGTLLAAAFVVVGTRVWLNRARVTPVYVKVSRDVRASRVFLETFDGKRRSCFPITGSTWLRLIDMDAAARGMTVEVRRRGRTSIRGRTGEVLLDHRGLLRKVQVNVTSTGVFSSLDVVSRDVVTGD